ncbi:T9SS type A sorting domain-containing protein, partial [Membranihabitans marinus]|uniref:T9SS type A sorting domain-containing protein n=1 Tax=Membranihabitans marinus TaxID=1227546 RepID=UPI001F3DC984
SDYEQSQFKPYPSEIEEAIRAGEQYSSAKDWEQCHPIIYTTESHDCAADVFVPSVTLKDNCSGLHSVKAMVNGRAVQLERLATTEEGYVTFAHTSNPIRIAFGGHGVQTEVRYEAADSCWNQSEWFKYIEIKDATPPTVIMDDEVLVSMTTKEAWVNAETFDEGSWDNCGIDLMLARRTDWWSDTACVDLCPTGETYTDWVDLLEDLGFSDVDGALAGVSQCGEYDYDITALKKFLNSETVENHYYQKLVWLWEDSYECGEFVVHGWIYDMVKYILLNDNCSGPDADHGNRLKIEEFEGFLDAITGKPGYGKEVSYLGGGWSPAIPFKCEDACETPTVELLVMDYWCNWGKGWLDVEVEDKSQAKVHRALADVAISCESYNVNYKSIIEAAAAYGEGGSVNDSTGAFDALNAAFGYYEAAWVNSNGVITDAAGNEITIEDLRFSIENITCAETEEVTKVADTLHDGIIDWINVTERTTDLVAESIDHSLGLLSILCQSRIETQDVWVDLDDCGNGIITRRFDISGGCGPKAPSFTLEQNIYVNSACELGMSMFDTPADTYTQESPVCVTSLEAASTELAPSVTGKVELKADLVGALCNSIAIGVKEEYISEVQTTGTDGPQMYKLTRVWNIRDWCSTIERDYEQTIVFVVDANCAANNGDVSLTGQITDQDQEAIAEVEVKAVLNSGSPLTAETTGNGQYGFNLDWGSSVSIVPQKNTGHGQGITTQDVIAIQSHVMQESVLTSDYDKVAADVDGNGMINAFDILETRRMVLTPNRKLANNTSWRFFVSDGSMRESFESTSLRADQNIDFVGVKIGDVNRTENVGRSQRSGLTTLNLSVVDQGLISGELYRVDVTSENFDEITGMQYTLAYANNAVEVESIEGGALNFTEDNYVKYRPGFITASWSEGKAISVSENEVLFTLVVRAKADVSLRDVLSVSDRVIMAEAYTGSEELKNIQLQYNRRDAIFALYQNTPNPYAGQTAIGFTLPEASEATLTMYDVTGKVLKVVEGSYGKGYNKVWVNSEDFGMSGVLYYQLDTEKYTATKKMVVIK